MTFSSFRFFLSLLTVFLLRLPSLLLPDYSLNYRTNAVCFHSSCVKSIFSLYAPGMLSPRGQHGQFFGLGLVVSGLGLVQRWPRSHLGWPRGKSSKSGHE